VGTRGSVTPDTYLTGHSERICHPGRGYSSQRHGLLSWRAALFSRSVRTLIGQGDLPPSMQELRVINGRVYAADAVPDDLLDDEGDTDDDT
jgi:hypothetical protein